MSDHLKRAPLWLIGAGPMAVSYGHVLRHLKMPFEVIGRGASSAASFREAVQVPVHEGGIETQLAQSTAPETAIVAVSLMQLSQTTKTLIEAGTSKILLEKPAALTLAAIAELTEFAAARGSEIYIAYNRRFNASTSAARQMIEEDGGVRSFHFEFTEWSHKIEALPHPPEVLENWLFANSSHVIDLAFHLGGQPEKLSCHQTGGLSWHPSASAFSGSGVTEQGALFSYQADWEAPGRWGVEILTANRRLILRPLEQLWIQEKGSIAIHRQEIDDSLDTDFKPGLCAEVQDFLRPQPNRLPSLQEHHQFAANILQPIAGLGTVERPQQQDRKEKTTCF